MFGLSYHIVVLFFFFMNILPCKCPGGNYVSHVYLYFQILEQYLTHNHSVEIIKGKSIESPVTKLIGATCKLFSL